MLKGFSADIEARNSLSRSPLLVACENGNIAKVKVLVKAGTLVRATDYKKETCLTLAAHHGHTETVRYLVGLPEVEGRNNGMNKHTALHSALLEGHSDVVQVLIDAGADIEARNGLGRSPLLVASSEGKLSIIKMLVEAGANACATDNEGNTCLTIAEKNGHTETVRYLAGLPEVDVNHAADENKTALHSAVHRGDTSAVHCLIDAGADIEAKDRMGRSPLHWACKDGDLGVVKMLVKAGAEVCATDNEGNTCFTIAEKNGHTETVRYLEILPEVGMNQTQGLCNTALEAASEQGTATKEEVKALLEMMKSVDTEEDKRESV